MASGCGGGGFLCASVSSNFLGFIGDKLAARIQETTLWFLPWDMGTTWHGERLFVIAFLTGITLLFGIVMGFFINANTFSLHAIYRNRLIRAYLAASCTRARVSRICLPGLIPRIISSCTS